MDQNLLIVLIIFVALVAVALLAQAAVMIAIYAKSKALIDITTRLTPKVEAVIESSRLAVDDSKKLIDEGKKLVEEVTAKTGNILDSARKQMGRVDELLEDASARARVQLDQAEMVLDDAMRRAQQTVAMVHGGVMKPLREIQGVTNGVRTAVGYLFRSRRSDPAHATADEEMFI